MKVERITTVHYTFQKGDIVGNKIADGAAVVLYILSTSRNWTFVDGRQTGLTNSDIQSNLDNFPDKWAYIGNKYEVFD